MGRISKMIEHLRYSPEDQLENMGYKYVDGDRRVRIYHYVYQDNSSNSIPVFDGYAWSKEATDGVDLQYGIIKRVGLYYDRTTDKVTCQAEYFDGRGVKLPYTAKLNDKEMTVFLALAKNLKDENHRGW